jgi:hypothetical protein
MLGINMNKELPTLNQDRIKMVLKTLQNAQNFQRDRLIYGINRVYRYVDDIDGDWLENWGEYSEANKSTLV